MEKWKAKYAFHFPTPPHGDEITMMGSGIFEPKQMLVFGKI
jgi:hypothetical protein